VLRPNTMSFYPVTVPTSFGRAPRVPLVLVPLVLVPLAIVCLSLPALAQASDPPPATVPVPAEPTPTPATDETQASAPTNENAQQVASEKQEELKPIPQKMQLQVPTVPPPVDRTYRVHRGFYLGLNAGIGHNSGSYDDNHPSGERLEAEGFNLVTDLLIGYGSSPGLALGGALMADFLVSENFERDGFNTTDTSSISLLLGPFVDGFPNPHGPLHVGGALGLAHVRAPDAAFDGSDLRATGLGFAAWVGYVPWVSDRFSIGASLRLMANYTGIGQDRGAATRSINLVVNALHF